MIIVMSILFVALIVGVIAMFETLTVSSGFKSTVMWNEEEVVLVMQCSERHARFTIPSMIKAWVEWHSDAATDAIPIKVVRYNIIYHAKRGQLLRYRINDPGHAECLDPYKGQVMPIGYDERLQREGWHFDNSFDPWSMQAIQAAQKEKVIRLKDCVLHVRLVNDLRPDPKPYRSPTVIAEHLFIWLEGGEDKTFEETFIREERKE
jgi:hypothetical protein